jgi:hypothetical protein
LLTCRPGVIAIEPAARYALYFAPEADHPLWQAGCTWLGRDPRASQPQATWRIEAVRVPWRYGFHATLAAPMPLRKGAMVFDFMRALDRFAQEQEGFFLPPLCVASLECFLALRPIDGLRRHQALHRLASAGVGLWDDWRAPLSPRDMQRRLSGELTPRQRTQVVRHGYAHVHEDWRFHMTLSNEFDDLAQPAAVALRCAAEAHFAQALSTPLACNSLCLFVEPAPGEPFMLLRRFSLRSKAMQAP